MQVLHQPCQFTGPGRITLSVNPNWKKLWLNNIRSNYNTALIKWDNLWWKMKFYESMRYLSILLNLKLQSSLKFINEKSISHWKWTLIVGFRTQCSNVLEYSKFFLQMNLVPISNNKILLTYKRKHMQETITMPLIP